MATSVAASESLNLNISGFNIQHQETYSNARPTDDREDRVIPGRDLSQPLRSHDSDQQRSYGDNHESDTYNRSVNDLADMSSTRSSNAQQNDASDFIPRLTDLGVSRSETVWSQPKDESIQTNSNSLQAGSRQDQSFESSELPSTPTSTTHSAPQSEDGVSTEMTASSVSVTERQSEAMTLDETRPTRPFPDGKLVYTKKQLLKLDSKLVNEYIQKDMRLLDELTHLKRRKHVDDPFEDFHEELVLRTFQKEAVADCELGKNDIVILPTGTGKTYVAIHVIREHLRTKRRDMLREGATGGGTTAKVIFLVPTSALAAQQLEKIKHYMALAYVDKCRKITGEDNIPASQLKNMIKGEEFLVLVVTPAILNNYFEACSEASIYDFTLLIFDECHHAKEAHPYNTLLQFYYNAKREKPLNEQQLPQLIGMSASIGIGKTKSLLDAKEFMLSMFARFNLRKAPYKITENVEDLEKATNRPDERCYYVTSGRRDDFTNFLETQIMSVLEQKLKEKALRAQLLENAALPSLEFPPNRHSQVYEMSITNLRTAMKEMLCVKECQEEVIYIINGLEHLLVYFKTLEMVDLLDCKQGLEYLKSLKYKPEYHAVDEIWNLLQENMDELAERQSAVDASQGNPKLTELIERLEEQFSFEFESKVIVFVRMRTVAKYLAKVLNEKQPGYFKAQEFTSSGPSVMDAGMKQSELINARNGFEGNKFNILVSTSVLEEGIDIQACNMVVRYMYSKDVIGKIQARGRVRHQQGRIVNILDDKLRVQEEKNQFKEDLMHQALAMIQAMTKDEFAKTMERLQKHLYPPDIPAYKGPKLLTEGNVICSKCGASLGDVKDIHCYMKSHFFALDGSIHERVIPYPGEFQARIMDGVVPYGSIHCKNISANSTKMCHNNVGKLCKLTDTGCYFAMWNIKGIALKPKQNKVSKTFKKYADLRKQYEIKIIKIEELQQQVDKKFPEEALEAAREEESGNYSSS